MDFAASRRRPVLRSLLRSVVFGPLWVAQVITGAKSFADNPVLGNAALNRMGLHAFRTSLAHRLAERRRQSLSGLVEAADRAAFDRDGIVVKPDFLPRREFEQLLDEVKAYRGLAREEVQGDTVTRRITLSPAVLKSMPTVRSLLAAPAFQGVTRYAGSFDAEPMFYLQTILSRTRDAPPDPQQNLHSDAFHPTAKAWLFLTDVAPDAAPLTYVKGSHKATEARLAWERRRSIDANLSADIRTRRGSFRLDPAELGALGLPQPSVIAVPANTLVVADTFGFHARGPSDRAALRVEIWGYLRHSPFLPWSRLGLWKFAPLARRRAAIFWRASDLAEAIGLKRNVWRARPDCSAFDRPSGNTLRPSDAAI
jgi:hypothetical protein